MKRSSFILAALLFCACLSTEPSGPISSGADRFGNFVTLPRSGNLVVIGVSGRQSSRDAEIEIAREDAARKVSMYHGMWVSIVSGQNIGAGFLDYNVFTDFFVDYDEQLEKYFDRLNFDPDRDLSRNNDGVVFIRFTYPAAFPGNISYSSMRNPDGSPEWVRNPPQEIGGFIAGVGTSGRQERLRDTMRRSYESAAAAIVSHASTSVQTIDTAIGGQTETHILRESAGFLTHFTVLEVWIDSRNGAVWTLAIARSVDVDLSFFNDQLVDDHLTEDSTDEIIHDPGEDIEVELLNQSFEEIFEEIFEEEEEELEE